ncbi:GDSL-type esterase/lipase family protein [Actinotalea sp. K2]|uniref:GDSL-type esterase/lipase family protein n=1 Tax=Actinotalea sp. K2 TaxID=2939438 RepID=UPI0020177BE4|nr:GDSL-type esterase/lipase family protein [Actinotalea sp. K2]MCL3859413.1 GDSL-type esterase/lipase family protein [Actinotalea sp. K2]
MGLVDVALVGGPVRIVGAVEVEPTAQGLVLHRLPAAARSQVPDDFMAMCERQPAGVRLVLRTAARRMELDVRALRTVSANRPPDGLDGPVPPAGRYDLLVDGLLMGQSTADEHGTYRLDFRGGTAVVQEGPVATVVLDQLPGRDAEVEIWLPYGEITCLVALRADAPVTPSAGERGASRWVHHGSSISHGGNADSPTGTWPVVAARTAGLDLVSLGFSGNAVLDPFVARSIRDQPADLITLKLGINVVNRDCLRRRAFVPAVEGFLDTIREGHPTTPVVVISPILCPMVEDCPGPTEIDPSSPVDAPVFRTLGRPEEHVADKLSLGVIREVLDAVVRRRRAAGDGSLRYLDGRELYGWPEWERLPMPDLLHPEARGHRHMGERFAQLLPTLLS